MFACFTYVSSGSSTLFLVNYVLDEEKSCLWSSKIMFIYSYDVLVFTVWPFCKWIYKQINILVTYNDKSVKSRLGSCDDGKSIWPDINTIGYFGYTVVILIVGL